MICVRVYIGEMADGASRLVALTPTLFSTSLFPSFSLSFILPAHKYGNRHATRKNRQMISSFLNQRNWPIDKENNSKTLLRNARKLIVLV